MLRDYLAQCGEECKVVRNDELSIEAIEQLDFDKIVLSPGPRSPAEAGITLALINRYYPSKPILGICLGHQAIGQFFGASLVKAPNPMHGMTSTIYHNGHPIFAGLPEEITVMRYHSLILTNIDCSPLQVIATTASGEIMAVAHPTLPIIGLQFHPESILTEQGLKMIKNWLLTTAFVL